MIKGKGYAITAGNVSGHELIGLSCRVVGGSDPSRIGLAGKIVDETRNTLDVESKGGVAVLPKKEVSLEVDVGGETVVLAGSVLVGRPEERVKNFCRGRKA